MDTSRKPKTGWLAAMLLWPDEPSERGRMTFDPIQADEAWTAEGALRLAELLPERLDDLRAAIVARFHARAMSRRTPWGCRPRGQPPMPRVA
jgi:hypothetical protein